MRSRIAIRTGAGFLVAACWVLFAYATHPNTNEWMREAWPLAALTCPIAALRGVSESLYQVLAANAVTYALVGLIIETARKRFRTQH